VSAHDDAVLAGGAGGVELGTFRGDGEGGVLAGGRLGGQREGERRPEQGRRARSRWSRWSRGARDGARGVDQCTAVPSAWARRWRSVCWPRSLCEAAFIC
jgi:hypothetical protein